MLDDIGNEALLVLHFHGVERTAVAVDADEKVVAFHEVAQRELWVARHRDNSFLSRSRSDVTDD
jgi:hypothetical protein